jgi:hypothetical protein
LYLVSGYGAPVNATHAPEGNSTESVARVMMQFMNRAYPAIYVRLAHSGNGVFRYDANVAFVNEKVSISNHHIPPPCLPTIRD